MKQGMTIQDAAKEIMRQSQAKADYLVNTANLHMETCDGIPILRLLDESGVDRVEPLDILTTAHRQMSAYLNIPWKYYERMRQEDIGLLAKSFIIQCNQKLEKNVKNISKATLERFQAYRWPGNVRELQHAIEHAMNILPDELSTITPRHIPEHILAGEEGPAPRPVPERKAASLNSSIRDAAYQAVCRALRESGGNISEAARTLNMSRQNLQYRIKRYQIDVNALLREKLK